MKLMRSLLLEPGSIRYGVRSASPSRGVAIRMRMYFLVTAIKSLILALFCFFLSNAAFDATGFITFNAIADRHVWGLGLAIVAALMGWATAKRSGIIARVGLVFSGVIMITAGASFAASAILYGAGWWGAVAYIVLGIMDMLAGSYPGEPV